MQDPTVPPPGDQWPSDPPPTPRQDHAVLAWLAVEADLPLAVRVHLLGALTAWTPLMGPHLFPIEPEAGVDCDLRQVLDAIWWRRSDQGVEASWADRVALYEVSSTGFDGGFQLPLSGRPAAGWTGRLREGAALLEVKTERGRGHADAALLARRVRPVSLSNYGVAVVLAGLAPVPPMLRTVLSQAF